MEHISPSGRPDSPLITQAPSTLPTAAHRVLRNTYALLSMTLLFSAAIATAGIVLQAPAPAQRQAPRQASTPGTSPAVRRIKEEIARKKGHQP